MSQNDDFYGYLPSKAAAVFGIAFFGVSTVVCLLQMVFGRYKHYWMITLAVAAAGETIGWGARLWAHSSVNFHPEETGVWERFLRRTFVLTARSRMTGCRT
jgi:hypothetical protein